MAGSADVRAGGAYVEFYAKGKDEIQKTLKNVQARMESMGKTVLLIGAGVAAMGAAATAPFLNGLSIYSEAADQISRIARETGYTREQISGLTYALDGQADALTGAASSIARFVNDAFVNPSSDAARALNEMGLRLEDLTGADRYEQLLRIADGLASIRNESRRATVAGVVGLSPSVATRISGGRGGISDRVERGRELGIVRPEAELQQMETYNRVFRDLSAAVKGLWMSIGVAAEPVMREFFTLVIGVIVGVRRLVDANRPFLTQIFRFADILVTAGGAIAFLGGGIITLSAGLGAMAAAFPFILIGLKVAAITLAVLVATAFSLWVVFELALGALRLFGVTGEDAFNAILRYFGVMTPAAQRLGETLTTMWNGFADAIMAGDIELAFTILSLGIQLIWRRTVNFFRDAWFGFKYMFLTTWYTLLEALSPPFMQVIRGLRTALVALGDMLADSINVWIDAIPEWVRTEVGISRVVNNVGENFDAATSGLGAVDSFAEERRLAAEHNAERERARSEEGALTTALDAAALDAWIAAEQRRIQGGFGLDEGGGPPSPYEAQRGLSVQGTFSAAAAYGFAGAGLSNAEQIAEESRSELAQIRQILRAISEREGVAMG